MGYGQLHERSRADRASRFGSWPPCGCWVTLIAATLVIPATVARMLTNSFARMLVLATAIGTVCGFVGMNLSYHLNVQSGPTIVWVGTTLSPWCS